MKRRAAKISAICLALLRCLLDQQRGLSAMRSIIRGLACLIAGCVLVAVGCYRSELSAPTLPAEQKKAVELAQQFLEKENVKWGEPSAIELLPKDRPSFVGEGRGRYRIVFQTPSQEIQRLGDRAVLVNTETAKAMFEPRD